MAEVTLEVTRREKTGKEVAKKLRREGKIPAVVYGGHREPVAIEVDRKSVSRAAPEVRARRPLGVPAEDGGNATSSATR